LSDILELHLRGNFDISSLGDEPKDELVYLESLAKNLPRVECDDL